MGGTGMAAEPEQRRGSNGARGKTTAAEASLPVKLGGAIDGEGEKKEWQGRRMPHLRDYSFRASWVASIGAFLLSAVRQGICNYLTASGIAGESIALSAVSKAVSTCGIMCSAFWAAQTLLGLRYRGPLIALFTVWSSVCYAVVFVLSPRIASLTMLPNVLLALVIGTTWSKRGCFALVMVMLTLALQVALTFIINSLPLVQSSLPEALKQFLVPVMKTLYVGLATEVLTLVWKKMYRRPVSPLVMTFVLIMTLVSAETMGVVGILAAVDSASPWINSAIFCMTTIVMETNSRSGILVSFLHKLMGKKHRFSDAAHIFRWGKMWASYYWICAFSGFVVPALVLGLKVEGSNFTFLRWEPWALLGIYVLQQVLVDIIYVFVQHYIRPSMTLSQTAARCFVLGEATPFFGENEHLGDDGELKSSNSSMEEELETASFKLGPWTIAAEALLTFLFFEYTMSVWNNYVRGQFCPYGTFYPSEDGSCD